MAYKFDERFPPLFERGDHNGDPHTVPAETLESVIGIGNWSAKEHREEHGRGFHAPPIDIIWDYVAIRKQRWAWDIPIICYPNDVRNTVHTLYGYSLTESRRVESTLGAKMSGGVDKLFSADVSASLKITEEVSKTWRTEYSEENVQTFDKGFTYVNWYLADVITVERHGKAHRSDGRGGWGPMPSSSASVANRISYRPDKFILRPGTEGAIQSLWMFEPKKGADDDTFCAVCDEVHGVSNGWHGPDRATQAEAQSDCDRHESEFSGHHCWILGV